MKYKDHALNEAKRACISKNFIDVPETEII